MRSLFASKLITTITSPAYAKAASVAAVTEPALAPMDMGAWRAWAKGASSVGEPAPSTIAVPKPVYAPVRAPQG